MKLLNLTTKQNVGTVTDLRNRGSKIHFNVSGLVCSQFPHALHIGDFFIEIDIEYAKSEAARQTYCMAVRTK